MENYRVWNRENNEWVDACLINTDGHIRPFEISFDYVGNPIVGTFLDDVDIEFTSGITDINKQKIFEGDFIRYRSFDNNEYIILCPSLYYTHFWEETALNETVRIIGNKHDTPDIKEGLIQ